jgi:hypothetical protein
MTQPFHRMMKAARHVRRADIGRAAVRGDLGNHTVIGVGRPSGSRVMDDAAGIQENDVVVTKVGLQYWVWQQVGKSRKRLDGPYDDLGQAESRAKVLAIEFGSDAWFENESKTATTI